jgi:hypothetical protein
MANHIKALRTLKNKSRPIQACPTPPWQVSKHPLSHADGGRLSTIRPPSNGRSALFAIAKLPGRTSPRASQPELSSLTTAGFECISPHLFLNALQSMWQCCLHSLLPEERPYSHRRFVRSAGTSSAIDLFSPLPFQVLGSTKPYRISASRFHH